MASVKCLVAVDAFRNKHSAGGTRTVFILGSLASLPSADVVFRRSITLSDEDKNTLSKGLALPPDRWTDLDVILTKYAQDENVSIGPQELFTQENEVSCGTVLAKLRDFFSSSTDKDGAVIHYFGNGRKFRGDWCFSDGYITFQDLMDVYMETYRGRVLTIVSDCSHSGSWVKQCYEFFEGQGIIPCGHHAVKKGILLKVFTSCRQNDTASVLRFSMQCIFVNKNTGGNINYNIPKKIGKMQQSSGKDFTTMLCGKKVDEECVRDSSMTWEMESESDRIYLVKGTDKGRDAWYYVLLFDDEENISNFKEALQDKIINLEKYGKILHSGFGKEPPNEVTEKLHKKYNIIK